MHATPAQVGRMLERPSAWPHHQHLRDVRVLRAELAAFLRDQGLPPKKVQRTVTQHRALPCCMHALHLMLPKSSAIQKFPVRFAAGLLLHVALSALLFWLKNARLVCSADAHAGAADGCRPQRPAERHHQSRQGPPAVVQHS